MASKGQRAIKISAQGQKEAQRGAAFAAVHWDFARVWAIDTAVNEGYPHLVGVGPAVQRHGDIDGDGMVNVSDVTVLINCVLGSASYSLDVSDIDGDSTVNVSDVTALINLVLNP